LSPRPEMRLHGEAMAITRRRHGRRLRVTRRQGNIWSRNAVARWYLRSRIPDVVKLLFPSRPRFISNLWEANFVVYYSSKTLLTGSMFVSSDLWVYFMVVYR
jgi:hypothetical protein